jgi:hypothetical protein
LMNPDAMQRSTSLAARYCWKSKMAEGVEHLGKGAAPQPQPNRQCQRAAVWY